MNRFRGYFFFFFLFGQNRAQRKSVSIKGILSFMPTVVLLVLIVICEIRLSTKTFKGIAAEHNIMLHSVMLLNMLPCVVAAFESFRMPHGTKYLKKIINIIVERQESRKFRKVVWKNVEAGIWKKYILILICCYSASLFRLVSSQSPLFGRFVDIWSFVVLSYKTASLFHIIFYVDLLAFLISSVAANLEAERQLLRKRLFFSFKEVVDIMKTVKVQHFQLCDCCQVVTKHFGTITIAIMIDAMFTVAVYGYFTFFYWFNNERLTVTIRKYYFNCAFYHDFNVGID